MVAFAKAAARAAGAAAAHLPSLGSDAQDQRSWTLGVSLMLGSLERQDVGK